MTANPLQVSYRYAGGSRRPKVRSALRGFAATLRRWRRRARNRRELLQVAQFDDRMLADIGISRADAEFLANKPFWRE